jgi:hypothetical protein
LAKAFVLSSTVGLDCLLVVAFISNRCQKRKAASGFAFKRDDFAAMKTVDYFVFHFLFPC